MTAAPCACVRIPAGVIAQVSTSLSVSAEIVALLTSDERTQVRRGCAPNNSRTVGGAPTVLPRFFVRPFGLRSGECACCGTPGLEELDDAAKRAWYEDSAKRSSATAELQARPHARKHRVRMMDGPQLAGLCVSQARNELITRLELQLSTTRNEARAIRC